jgi:hypothetical protein
MTTNKNTSHADCYHDSTKSERAKCRRERAQALAAETAAQALRATAANELIEVLGASWVTKGAITFTDFTYADSQAPGAELEAALALLAYFAPSGDADEDARRLRNGYTITTDPHTIRRIILRRFS